MTKDSGDLFNDEVATEDVTPEPEVYVIFPEGHALNVGFSPNSTIQDLLQAEQTLHPDQIDLTAVSFLGMPLATDLPLHPDMALMIKESHNGPTQTPSLHHEPPVLKDATRAELLWQQQGWVAVDEMEFYLHMIEAANPTTILGTYEFPDTADATAMFAHRLLKAIEATGSDVNSMEKAMAWKFKHHWFPVLIRASGPHVEIWTTHAQVGMLQQALQAAVQEHPYVFRSTEMPHAFQADCGYQTVGWILSMLIDEDVEPWASPID